MSVADIYKFSLSGGTAQLGAGSKEGFTIALTKAATLNGLQPPWVRPAAPRLPTQEGEVSHIEVRIYQRSCLKFSR